MTTRQFTEDTTLTGIRTTDAGYLVGMVNCARTGIQEYSGSEIGIPSMDRVRVYRPESEVFSKDSLATYVGKPATDNHPPEMVDSSNWKKYAVGQIGEDVLRDGDLVRVPLILMDAETIQKVKDGKREISMGYLTDVDMTSGETPEGEAYDAIQRNLKMNHLAVVDNGRAGSKARIGDNQNWGISPLITNDGNKPMIKTQSVVVDGISIETTDQGAQAIGKLQKALAVSASTISTLKTTHDTAIAGKDTELATKDAKIADLEKATLSTEALDAKVQARADLIANASKLAKDADFKGMTDADIIKTAVIAVRGEDAMKDKSDAYIQSSFDIAVEGLDSDNPDAFRDAMKNKKPVVDNDNGQEKYERNLNDAWKMEVAK